MISGPMPVGSPMVKSRGRFIVLYPFKGEAHGSSVYPKALWRNNRNRRRNISQRLLLRLPERSEYTVSSGDCLGN
jgi:hypothetical protein